MNLRKRSDLKKRSGTSALRATVPAIVVSILGAKAGDRIRWTVDVSVGRVTVTKEPK